MIKNSTALFLCILLLALMGVVTVFAPEPVPSHKNFSFKNPIAHTALARLPAVDVRYYDVHGSDAAALREQMDRKGPLDMKGRRRDAFSQWHIRWNWEIDADGSPQFETTKSTHRLTVILPRWIPSSDSSVQLQQEWKRYFTALVSHELGHVQHALQNADNPAKKIREAAERNARLTLLEAHRIGRKALAAIQDFDDEYDLKTHSGRAQGAGFP